MTSRHYPNSAPAYYLGHPARLWITVMGPRSRHRASDPPARRARTASATLSAAIGVRIR